ncbi:MAG TPA: OmpA family protein [Kofleriaceae bacterium]|jgi:outer membrane protein OmpA-like peptidoglycan-associated protein
MGTKRAPWALLVLLAAAPAAADGLDGERFVPATGAEGTFTVEHPSVPSPWGWSVGLFESYADDQIVLRDDGGGVAARPLHTGVTTDLVASLGLFGWAELGIGLPLHLVYDGDPYVAGGSQLDANAGVGDLRLVPKFALLRRGTLHRHVLLGLGVPVSFPTGNDEAARGAGGFTVHPELLFAYHVGRLGLGFDGGYAWRSHHAAALPWADELTISPWLAYGLTRQLTARVELNGEKEVDAAVAHADFPIEVLGGLDYAIGNADLYLGASRGVTDGVGDPAIRIIGGIRYRHEAPRHQGFEDSDHDGVMDKDDKCRDEPEDEDGFEDADGCPDPDNDQDGIPDTRDECPEVPGDAAHDGCPAKTYVRVEDGRIYIFGKVQFATGSDQVDHRSEPLLHQIAEALKANPGAHHVRIEGYTDDVGDPAFNQSLSERRASSVREELIKRGIAPDRLSTKGYGESKPVAPNKAPAGRARNRRVEFIIVGGM